MSGQDLILIGRAVNALGEVQDILRVLVTRGSLPESWGEIETLLRSIQTGLREIENEFGASPSL